MDDHPFEPSSAHDAAASLNSPPPGGGAQQQLFDFATAVARLEHDLNLFQEMVGFFRSDSADLLRQLRDALRQGHVREVQRAAHSLKGLAATFEAHLAMEAARRVEEMGSAGQLENVAQALPRLEFEVARLSQALADFRPPAPP
jgi:HPt (histidine-containing phosphotransfer) domain-containing protein